MTKEETIALFKQLLKQQTYLKVYNDRDEDLFLISVEDKDFIKSNDNYQYLRLRTYVRSSVDNSMLKSFAMDMMKDDDFTQTCLEKLDEALANNSNYIKTYPNLFALPLTDLAIDILAETYQTKSLSGVK